MERNNHKDTFIESLKDNKVAEAYFNEALEDCKKLNESEAQAHLITAFKNIAAAQGKLGEWVSNTSLGEAMMTGISKLVCNIKK